MSDRLAIIGGDVTGQDHFPFPITESGGFSQFLGIDGQCLLFYIVRSWLIQVDLAPPDDVGDPGPFTLYSAISGTSTLITREAELCLTEAPLWVGGLKRMQLTFGADGTVEFELDLYNDQGPVEAVGDWNDQAIFGDDVEYRYSATPLDFWSYATKTGLPVYDTATGTLINPPIDAGELYETITQSHGGTPSTLNVKTDSQPWIPI